MIPSAVKDLLIWTDIDLSLKLFLALLWFVLALFVQCLFVSVINEEKEPKRNHRGRESKLFIFIRHLFAWHTICFKKTVYFMEFTHIFKCGKKC